LQGNGWKDTIRREVWEKADKTPFEHFWTHHRNMKLNLNNFDDRNHKMIFVGYEHGSK
jgi:hypothetical protein